jgi:hypothetical protein
MAQEKIKKTFSGMAESSINSHEAESGTSTSYPGIKEDVSDPTH